MITTQYVTRLKSIIAQTKSRYNDIPSDLLAYKATPDRWSKREILGHLIDSARYNLMRFSEILLTDDVYIIGSYQQNLLVQLHDYQHQSDVDVIATWHMVNKQIIALWSQTSDVDLHKKIAVKDDIKTLDWLIVDYLDHMDHHMGQIFEDSTIYTSTPCQIGLMTAVDAWKKVFLDDEMPFVQVLSHGELEIEFYKPNKVDNQSPHQKDEVYVIASGTGNFLCDGKVIPFYPQDVLFVKAGVEHRFFDFTDDFATWVIFYGICQA